MSDLLIICLALLSGLNGARRGGLAEGITGAGLVVTGALIIAPPVAALSGQDFVLSTLVALTCLAFGFGLGNLALRRVQPSADRRGHRVIGAVCGSLNAVWIATYLLAEWQLRSRAGSLDPQWSHARLGPFLVEHVEVALLTLSFAVLALSGCLAVCSAWQRLGDLTDDRAGWQHQGLAMSGSTSVRLPNRADAGKLEPRKERGQFLATHLESCRTFTRSRFQSHGGNRRSGPENCPPGARWPLETPQQWHRIGPDPSFSPDRNQTPMIPADE